REFPRWRSRCPTFVARLYGPHPGSAVCQLARRQILVRLQEQGVQQVPFEGETFDLIPADFGQREVIRQHSRARYARPRAEVEEKIARFFRAARRKSPP